MIQILLMLAAAMLASASAGLGTAARMQPAELQSAAPAASGAVLAQNVAQAVAGTFAGRVERRNLQGEARATRTYRLTMNPDMNTGKVLIYDLDGQLLSELGLVGKMTDAQTFEGTTAVITASASYKPDHVRLVFAADGSSVEWYHNDGTLEGSGRLSR